MKGGMIILTSGTMRSPVEDPSPTSLGSTEGCTGGGVLSPPGE